MKIVKVLVAAVVILCAAESQLEGMIVNGGRGLPHAKAAYTTRKGYLTTMGRVGFWGKKSTFPNKTLNIETGSTLWVVNAEANLTYGFSSHGDISISPILYQDAHKVEGDQLFR